VNDMRKEKPSGRGRRAFVSEVGVKGFEPSTSWSRTKRSKPS
jgi:hypothetical protein